MGYIISEEFSGHETLIVCRETDLKDLKNINKTVYV